MLFALTLALLAQAEAPHTHHIRESRRLGSRSLVGQQFATFEAFPANGAGTTGVCSTSAPTGAKGEALTFARGSNGTCTRGAAGGLRTTGIADGDLVVLSSNVARQMFDSNGVLGLLVEPSRTNSNLQSANLADAVYTSVGTPSVTANTTVSPDGTTTMATINDTSGAAQQGRQQVIVATAGQPYTLSVFVKAGTLSSVTVSLDGTTATCTGLSATTSTRCIVTDASASGVAINAQVLGGTVVGDTGTFRAWGQQVELGSFATSYIPTAAGAVTRSADTGGDFNGLSISTAAGLSWAASVQHPSGSAGAVWAVSTGVYQDVSNRTQLWRANTNVQNCDIFTTSGNRSAGPVITAYTAGQVYRQACSYSGAGASSTISGYRDGVLTATSATGLTSALTATTVIVGAFLPASAADGAIISRVCVDPNPSRCR
jgi:hypothetical protein